MPSAAAGTRLLRAWRRRCARQHAGDSRAGWSDAWGKLKKLRSANLLAAKKKDRWTSNGLLDGEVRDVILAHLCAFPIALKQHLRGVRSGQEIYSVFEALGVRQSLARAWRPPDRRLHAPLSRSLASPA